MRRLSRLGSLPRGVALGAVCALLALGGCSFSDSVSELVTSPSDSLSKSSESISDSSTSFSDSSGSGEEGSSLAGGGGWRRDLRAFGVAFVTSDADASEFLRGVGRVSRAHGVTHWEVAPTLLVAVGEGLRDAQVPAEHVRARLAGVDPRALALVLAPYGSGQE